MGQSTVTVTDQNWEEIVATSTKPVLVDFWADWCGPCHMVAPTIEEIASEEASRLKVGKLNVDENPEAARRYGVMSIPSMLLFVDGVEKARVVGARGKAQILGELEPYLG
ncbi:MAG: thioredoxin [Actinomycetota bacterium]